jgi:hypothetical protein
MSVPLAVFETAGFSSSEAAKMKKRFDEQDVLLQHLATGEITQVRTAARFR